MPGHAKTANFVNVTINAWPNNSAFKPVITTKPINAMEHLEISIGNDKQAHYSYSRDFLQLARAIGKLALHEDEFAVSLNLVMIGVNEEIQANRVRDELIQMTKPKQR